MTRERNYKQMADSIATLMFYVFSLITVFSALMVVSSKNPVHSVLFLILAFFNAAGLFVLLGAEYIAMTLVIVYVGAVAVLFLFVVMMLNVNFAELRAGFLRYLPFGGAVALTIFAELVLVFRHSLFAESDMAAATNRIDADISNTEAIGNILYTNYALPFQMAGVILLIAMIGAIVLTKRERIGVKKQNVSKQLARRKEDCIEIVKYSVSNSATAQD